MAWRKTCKFHQAIAAAAHNPFLIGTLDYLAQFMRGAIGVTRANEARRADFAAQVRDEHAAVVRRSKPATWRKARAAASRHMNNAIRRIESADPAFWRQEGRAPGGPAGGSAPSGNLEAAEACLLARPSCMITISI